MWWMRSVSSEHAQHELEVLDRVEGRIEAAGALGELAAHHQQVTDVHRPERVGGRPVGLEEGIGAVAVPGELVGVGVDEVELGVIAERLGDPQQGIGGQHVVVVEEGDELPPRQRQGGVGRRGDAGVSLAQPDLDPLVAVPVALEHGPDLGRARAVVGDAQLPVRVALVAHRLDRLGEQPRIGLVGRHHDRDQRSRRERADLLGDRAPTSAAAGGERRPAEAQAHQPGLTGRASRRRCSRRRGRVSRQLSERS